jgi:hypothetical protein
MLAVVAMAEPAAVQVVVPVLVVVAELLGQMVLVVMAAVVRMLLAVVLVVVAAVVTVPRVWVVTALAVQAERQEPPQTVVEPEVPVPINGPVTMIPVLWEPTSQPLSEAAAVVAVAAAV